MWHLFWSQKRSTDRHRTIRIRTKESRNRADLMLPWDICVLLVSPEVVSLMEIYVILSGKTRRWKWKFYCVIYFTVRVKYFTQYIWMYELVEVTRMCWCYLLLRQRLLPTRSYGGALFSFNTAATATRRRIKIYHLMFFRPCIIV